jgi:phage terminase large subunit GpA-like protein
MTSAWIERANGAVKHGLAALRVLPPMRLSEWAAQYFYLSKESSYTEGRWQAYPYQRFILDAFGNDDIESVAVRKSARTGYTKMLMAATAFFTVYRRRNQAIWQPTDSDAQEFVETEYNPMLRDVQPIRDVFPHLEKKHAHNKNDFKKFAGCVTYIKGGSTARNYRRISVDVAILDEVDGFDKDIDQEGSPRKLSKKRTEGATFPKQIVGSTPKLKYLSEIDAAVDEAEAVYTYRVPCPHCGARQTLEFGGKDKAHGLKWHGNDPETAAYACVACAVLFTQAEYLGVWHSGLWEDGRGNRYDEATGTFRNSEGDPIRPPKHIAVDRLWAIYSPQTTWAKIVKEFLDAAAKAKHGDKSDLKTFINTTLGESYEEDAEKTDASQLKQRAEDFPLQVVPRGGLILKAGVDVQKDRFEVVVWAFGRGEEMWTVDYRVIEANPAIESEWEKLDPALLRTYPHVSGARLAVEHAALDTGGHWTHEAYNYVRDRRQASGWTRQYPGQIPPRLYATKGSSTAGQKIHGKSSLVDVNQRGKVIKHGLRLYLIGTESAKDLIFNRLQIAEPGPGCMHLSKHLPDAFFEHLTNEVRVTKHTPKGQLSVWVLRRSGARNECLDCTVMAVFCADKIGLQKKTHKEWDLLEAIVQPNQNDLFAPPLDPPGGDGKEPGAFAVPTKPLRQPGLYIPE